MNLFNSVKIKNPKRNKFNLSHSVRLTTEFGRLTPVLCEPVLPADKFTLSTTLKIQFAPMTFPVMERFKAYLHYWFVPNRLVWSDWEEFITGGESGIADKALAYPVIKCGSNLDSIDGSLLESNFNSGTLFDYLGFPAKTADFDGYDIQNLGTYPKYFDALPFKAYQLICNEFYRDQNLEDAFDIHPEIGGVQDNDDDNAFENGLMSLRYRAWKKDYFTSALPDPQRGPDVTLPLLGSLKIQAADGNFTPLGVNRAVHESTDADYNNGVPVENDGGYATYGGNLQNGQVRLYGGNLTPENIAQRLDINDEMRSATINEVRRGFALQRLYELAARVGGRYAENIFGNFGVHAGDARLQRPEYLGGSVVPVYVGDVLQTSETSEDGTPLGMPAGVAAGVGSSREFSRHFSEHGWIIGILSIVPEAAYIQGVPRKFLKRDRLDFAWPLLANIGEQEIESQELYFDFGATDDQNKKGFGYAPRYAEYKYASNTVHGDFRGSLADFHDARIFESRPALNAEFIKVKPTGNDSGINRIFAVMDENYDHLWVNMFHNCIVRRKLPKYGTPI